MSYTKVNTQTTFYSHLILAWRFGQSHRTSMIPSIVHMCTAIAADSMHGNRVNGCCASSSTHTHTELWLNKWIMNDDNDDERRQSQTISWLCCALFPLLFSTKLPWETERNCGMRNRTFYSIIAVDSIYQFQRCTENIVYKIIRIMRLSWASRKLRWSAILLRHSRRCCLFYFVAFATNRMRTSARATATEPLLTSNKRIS